MRSCSSGAHGMGGDTKSLSCAPATCETSPDIALCMGQPQERCVLRPVVMETVSPVVTTPVGTGDVKVVVPVLVLAAIPGNTGGGMAGVVCVAAVSAAHAPCRICYGRRFLWCHALHA